MPAASAGIATGRSGALRLLHVVPTYLPAVRYGGPIRTVHALCRELAAAGHDVQVFTTSVDGPRDSDVPLMRPVNVDGVQVTYFPSRSLRRLYWSPPMRRAISQTVRGFDLVHLHSVFLWPTWAAARAARAVDVPYVVSPRGMLVPELIRRKSRWVKSAWLALIERWNLESAAAIHATSEVEVEHLARFGWKLPPIVMIPHGVDDPPARTGGHLSADVADALSDGRFALALGRISWEKGFDRLIAALPAAPHARLIIAGNDADGLVASLAAQSRALAVDDRVTIIARHVEGDDKEALFAGAALFAMTSLSENFGLAALEAMRRGLPVLATPDVGISEIVRESGGGRVVDARPDLIADALRAMMADPAGSRMMGERGRDYVISNYGWPTAARRMLALYEGLTAHARKPGSR